MVITNKENLKFVVGGLPDLLKPVEGKPFRYAVEFLKGKEALARQIYYTEEGYVVGINRQGFLNLVMGKPLSFAVKYLDLEESVLIRAFQIQEGYIIGYNM